MSAEMLDAETELELARAWRDDQDEAALHRLIKAYMRLAVSMAAKFKRYGVSQQDLVQEAGVGLMKAAEKFDPDRGVRFSTYAQWWIKASIQDYVMRNYSMVRTGSTTNQKSLFFNLKRVKAKLEREAEQRGERINTQDLLERVSREIGVPMRDVEMIEGRLSAADFSLNAVQASDEDGREWQDTIADEGPQAEELVSEARDMSTLRGWLSDALATLTDRERYIIVQRKMIEMPRTLESIGEELKLSKERVRQIEAIVLEKLRKRIGSDGDRAARMMELV
jgi:RNA polymerase sigma-32 factor